MWWQRDGIEQWLIDFLHDTLQRRGQQIARSAPDDAVLGLISNPGSFGFSAQDMQQLASRFANGLGLDRTGLSTLLLTRQSAQGWCDIARRSRQIYDQQIGLYPLGATDQPKPRQHELNKLRTEAEFFARQLPHFKRIICTVPSHHLYGFVWGQLLPLESKVPCLFINIGHSLNPDQTTSTDWTQQLQEHDLIVASAATWQRLAEMNTRLPEHFVGISSTALLPTATAERLRAQNPAATLVEIYGNTDTAGLAWRSTNDTGFALLPWWQLTQTLQVSSVSSSISNETHLLPDVIEHNRSGQLHIGGRLGNIAQLPGISINLLTLAERIREHADIAAAKVVHEAGSERLHFFLALPKEPANPAHWCMEFSRWLEQHLGDVPAPTSVVMAAELPASANHPIATWNPDHFDALVGVYRSGF